VTNYAPQTFSLGVTVVVFIATENEGNSSSAQATVTVTEQCVSVNASTGNTAMTLNHTDFTVNGSVEDPVQLWLKTGHQ
jgi:hypothetical protein